MAYVYVHIRKDNNKPFYVGVGGLLSFDNYQRANANTIRNSARNKHWKSVVNLYGFDVEIISDNCTKEEACEIEIYLIKYYGRIDLKTGTLVNLTDGGEGNRNLSQESRLKIGKIHKGKIVSKETRDKISKANSGRIPSKETKMKIAIANTGKKLSEENRLNLISINKNRVRSIEERIKISSALIGRKQTYETRIKKSKKVIDTSNGITYNCAKDISEQFNINYYTLLGKLSGKDKNNTTFKYL